MVWTFFGQLVGTSVGSRLYEEGGWIASGSYSVGSIGAALIFTLVRGPWENGWVGWHGGWSIFKKSQNTADGKTREVRSHLIAKEKDQGPDVEEILSNRREDLHEHQHGHDDQEAVNATEAEKSLEMMAAEDTSDGISAAGGKGDGSQSEEKNVGIHSGSQP